ncbi:hypothetical protein HMI56_005378 [Coelomomyces lativittatus]|nr:hypothetical protein HMI56_005378 [Coelomomyces lativittatus]
MEVKLVCVFVSLDIDSVWFTLTHSSLGLPVLFILFLDLCVGGLILDPRSTGPAQLGSNNTLFIDTTLYPSTFSRAMCVSSDLGRYQLASVRGTSVKVEEENSFSGLIVLGQGPVHFVTLDNATMELNVWGPYWYGNPSFTYVPVNESTWEGDAHQTVVVGIDVQSSSGVHTLSTTSTTNTTKASLVTSSSSTTTSTKSTATPVQQMIRSRSERPYGSTPSWLWTCLMILVSMTFF